ncbi:hypothetical protein QZK47_18335 [Acinetobacter baumannii]|nr:hypothetical protein [Acinetobacter baumannii]MCA4237956.1 hypothetical protein [Acinetobacter baumannii]MCA4256764.1 hypothetical protein [Acinetobacter baumannii]MCA4260348.1 hypothetical protein [Acinetobacter baumannii]MCA4275191.1 hypothetical protein [Acinetobacter baumannii]MCA4349244.1 hypothetical protein [Acinetobacter baumannii]
MNTIENIEKKLELARRERDSWKKNSHNYIMASKLVESIEKDIKEKLREHKQK